MPRFPLLLVPVMAVALAGCGATGQYTSQVKPIAVPAQYAHAGADAGREAPTQQLPPLPPDAAPTASPAWWRGFGDARLDRLVDQVLALNGDLAAAGFALRQAQLQLRLAENDQWPQPSAGLDASASRRVDTGDAFTRSYGANMQVSWEVDLFGRLRAQQDVQAWRALASAEDLQATALSLAGETTQRYLELAYLNQAIAAGEQNLAELARILQLVQAQHAAGHVSRLEVREAEQMLDAQRAAHSALQQQRVETRNALMVLRDGQPWPIADEPTDLSALASLPVREGLPADLLGRRPDLRAAERRLRAALDGIQATARSYYPALSLTGALGSSSASLSHLLGNPVATLGAGLSLPFLNITRMRTDIEIAGNVYLEAASRFRGTLYGALREVDNALSARTRHAEQVAANSRSLAASQDVARMMEVRYRSGAVPLRAWLDARQTLRNTELAQAQSRRDQLASDVALVLALGGDAASVESPAANPPEGSARGTR